MNKDEIYILRDYKKCPREFCFHWIAKGDYYSNKLSNSLNDALKQIEYAENELCGCSFGKCKRIYKIGKDYYEPNEPLLKQNELPISFFSLK